MRPRSRPLPRPETTSAATMTETIAYVRSANDSQTHPRDARSGALGRQPVSDATSRGPFERSRPSSSLKIRKLLTSSAGTYIVTITQFTPSGSVNTLNRIDWMIALTVSSIPTVTHTQTSAMAYVAARPQGDQRQDREKPRCHVAVPDHLAELGRHTGADRSGSQDRSPGDAEDMDPQQGHERQLHRHPRQARAPYQAAMSEYATRLNVNWIPNNTMGSIIRPPSRPASGSPQRLD